MSFTTFITDAVRIKVLQRQARQHLSAYDALTGDLSCGRALTEYIRPEAAVHKEQFNATMDHLATLDPACPKFRL